MGIDQWAIPILGLSAIWAVNGGTSRSRMIGAVLGLLSQPFWFYATFKAQQWGIFAACFIYTISWARGLYINAMHLWFERLHVAKKGIKP